MSRMSELHDDLSTIHTILLGQRKAAADRIKVTSHYDTFTMDYLEHRIDVIDDLLLELEASGIVWPDNVVELNAQT